MTKIHFKCVCTKFKCVCTKERKMTLNEAKTLRVGDYIHCVSKFNSDGTPMRARVTSIKTWKTRPDEILIGYKHGLYDFGKINETELSDFSVGYGS